jgi:hypothetical protein
MKKEFGNYFDRKGKRITAFEWAQLIEQKEFKKYKIVEQTTLNGLPISTVWLGINHNFEKGKPLIFETR